MGLVKFLLKASIFLWILLSIILWFVLSYVLKGESSPVKHDTHYAEILSSPDLHSVRIQKIPCVGEGQFCLVVSGSGSRQKKTANNIYGIKKRGSDASGFLVMLHEKNGRKEELLPEAVQFAKSGFTVILVDLPGHGDTESEFTWSSNDDDAEFIPAALFDVKTALGRSSDMAYLWSTSVGIAYANRTVEKYPNLFKAMVVNSGYNNLENLFLSHLDFMPDTLKSMIIIEAKFFAGFKGVDIDKSTPDLWAKNIEIPVLVLHGKKDEFIPIELGKKLFESYKSNDKKWVTLNKAGHTNILKKSKKAHNESIKFLLKQ